MTRRTFTIGQRIACAFFILLALLTAVAGFSWRGLTIALRDFDEYRHCARSSVVTGRIQANFLDMRIEVKDFLLARSETNAAGYRTRHEKVSKLLNDARVEVTEPDRIAMLNAIAQSASAHAEKFALLCAAAAPGKENPEAINTYGDKLHQIGDATAEAVENLKLSIIAQQDQIGPRARAHIQRTLLEVLFTGGAAVLVGLLAAGFSTRSINRILKRMAESIDEGADQVAAAANQVSAASQALAEGASEQAAAIEETSSSIEEIASMTKSNATGSRQAKELSTRTRLAAEAGAAAIDEMSQAMHAIKTSSDDMAKILKTIDEIAFQTNILALNAAVEAARAGEAGAGFAVVADEVRSLAQRSARSAKETSGKIEDSMQKCENGVAISGRVAESLREILGRAKEVDTVIAEIARACDEQDDGLSQVSTAVTQMDKVTQNNASSAEEAAASAEELTAQAEAQKGTVAELLALVGKAKRNGPPARLRANQPQPERAVALAYDGRGAA